MTGLPTQWLCETPRTRRLKTAKAQPKTTMAGQKRKGLTGGTRRERTGEFWYGLCALYQKHKMQMNMTQFLRSKVSGDIEGTQSEILQFSRRLKLFAKGELKRSRYKRSRGRKYGVVEEKIAKYAEIRMLVKPLDFETLRAKAQQFAELEGGTEDYDDFEPTNQWLRSVLQRNHVTKVKIMAASTTGAPSNEEEEANSNAMETWTSNLHTLFQDRGVSPDSVYSMSQTALFYTKLPNRHFHDEHAITTQMISDERLALIICTNASGMKVPLAAVGKPGHPSSFRLSRFGHPPFAYKSQAHAMVDKPTLLWWINDVFWKHHLRVQGDVPAVLMLDHSQLALGLYDDVSAYPENLSLQFLPPEGVPELRLPTAAGVSTSLKIGYKLFVLSRLLSNFDIEGGYEGCTRGRSAARGLNFGEKPSILDAMQILDNIWSGKSRFADEFGIRKCWAGAGILPLSWNNAISLEVAVQSLPVPQYDNRLSNEDCGLMCDLANTLIAKSKHVDTAKDAYKYLADSFVGEKEPSRAEMQAMFNTWVCVEDDPSMLETVVEWEIEQNGLYSANHKSTQADSSSDDEDVDTSAVRPSDGVEGKVKSPAKPLECENAETLAKRVDEKGDADGRGGEHSTQDVSFDQAMAALVVLEEYTRMNMRTDSGGQLLSALELQMRQERLKALTPAAYRTDD